MSLVELSATAPQITYLSKIGGHINTPREQDWQKMVDYFTTLFSSDLDEVTLTSKDNIKYNWKLIISTGSTNYTPNLSTEKEKLNDKLAELNEYSKINSLPDRYEISDLEIVKITICKNNFIHKLQFIVQKQNYNS